MYLIFDTETTGLPRDFKAPITDTDNWPRCIQIAWQLHDENGDLVEAQDYLVKPDGFDIPFQSEQIHGISTVLATEQGEDLQFVLEEFNKALAKTKFVVGQNVDFDVNVMGCEFYRMETETPLAELPVLDTCTEHTAEMCQIPGGRGGKFKLPTLTELHEHLFNQPFAEAHNATADVEATARCFLELVRLRQFTSTQLGVTEEYFTTFSHHNNNTFQPVGLKHLNLKAESAKLKEKEQAGEEEVYIDKAENLKRLENVSFSHLHNHTQFSILQSTTQINALIAKASEYQMPAVALTDIGNMMGAFHFVNAGLGHNKNIDGIVTDLRGKLSSGKITETIVRDEVEETIERAITSDEVADIEEEIEQLLKSKLVPIVGTEVFVCKDRLNKSFKDNGYLVPLLAKNKKGYHNLAKLSSIGHVEGYYYVPRVDRDVILQYKEEVIATTGGINGEIPQLILNVGEQQAEEAFVWWHEQFGEDFYVELNRHFLDEEKLVNATLLKFAKKYGVKYFAANNNYYIDKKDAEAHDILLCIKDGEKKATPKGRGRGFRFGLANEEYYLKSQQEMKELFYDLPEAIETTNEIVAKCEPYGLARDVLLPKFDIPEEFQDPLDDDPSLKNGENNYLRHITYEGAKERYGEVTPEIAERLDFELDTIRNTGYPGYFLIVEDFIRAARNMGVSVGPGRGSAAGSAVAYCTGITNIDPIKYDLLFERFLNPERVSMPDIDIDFDDEGRGRVIQYVIDKYGASQVAQIITYGTMAAKSSIRDAGRVLDLPLPDTDRVAKLVPDMKLNKLFNMPEEKLVEKLDAEQMNMANELKMLLSDTTLEGEVVRQAKTLEGSMRNTGIHACGVIITPSDIREHVPVALAKDSEMWSTQFDNSVVESAGLLKMDFLGLKTLTLIKDTLKIVKARHGLEIDIEKIPIDDEETYALFQRGETVGVFQYESAGMQKYLKELKPTEFSDLIAMNALYRPGPLEYIPSFIKRKHGEEEITYDIDVMEEYLQETYGITVYQEQVMLLSQKLADFTKGEADVLRKAMGKKQIAVLAKMKPKFVEQAMAKGHPEKKLEKIWTDWEAFASYAFNKSHSTCYAWIAYQTAYLKAHYPAEYMAAVLSNNMNDIKTVTFFMEECRRMGLKVLGPDVNESYYKFAVNPKGEVRFGMGGMKGVGAGPVNSMVEERKKDGPFQSIFDMVRRVSLKDVNKRVLESLAYGGAFDNLSGMHRAQYFAKDEKDRSLIEKAIKYGQAYQQGQNSAQVSLFDMMAEDGGGVDLPEPQPAKCEPWSAFEKLNHERDIVGIYITGHPLEDYQIEIDNFMTASLEMLSEDNIRKVRNGEFSVIGISGANSHTAISRKGNQFGKIELHDMTGNKEMMLFGEQFQKFSHFVKPQVFLYITGTVQLKSKRYNPDGMQKEFRINTIELLENVRDKLTKKLYIRFDLAYFTEAMTAELEDLFEKHHGTKSVAIEIVDFDENSAVTLLAKDRTVNPTNEFFKDLKKIGGYLDAKVNKTDLQMFMAKNKKKEVSLDAECGISGSCAVEEVA